MSSADRLGFKAARQTRDLVRHLETKRPPRTNWKDRAERATYLRDEARRRRLAALDAIVLQRRCPLCSQVKTDNRKWVLIPVVQLINAVALKGIQYPVSRGETALCRSCVQRKLKGLWGKKRIPTHQRVARKF